MKKMKTRKQTHGPRFSVYALRPDRRCVIQTGSWEQAVTEAHKTTAPYGVEIYDYGCDRTVYKCLSGRRRETFATGYSADGQHPPLTDEEPTDAH